MAEYREGDIRLSYAPPSVFANEPSLLPLQLLSRNSAEARGLSDALSIEEAPGSVAPVQRSFTRQRAVGSSPKCTKSTPVASVSFGCKLVNNTYFQSASTSSEVQTIPGPSNERLDTSCTCRVRVDIMETRITASFVSISRSKLFMSDNAPEGHQVLRIIATREA